MLFTFKAQLQKIIAVLNKAASGDFTQRLNIHTGNEIGRLANAIDAVIDKYNSEINRLEKITSQTQAILSNMAEGVIAVDKYTKIIFVNPALEKIFNLPGADSRGKFLLEVIRNNDIAETINSALKNSGAVSKEVSLTWPVQKIFKINATPILEKDGITGCVAVIHDITELRKLEAVHRDFVANVSHELKTPLTAVKGFVETLIAGGLEDTQNSRQFLEIIQNNVNRLDNLINDLLSLAYLESQEISLKITGIGLKGLADEVLPAFSAQINKKNITVENTLLPQLRVEADKDKLEQVLVNLIDNAIKFNKENGKIKIYGEDLGANIKVSIEDSGCGIPQKDIARVFERFYRVDKARSRELGGTGLGLSIVKHIIGLHGGTTGAESVEGAGSIFWVTLKKPNL